MIVVNSSISNYLEKIYNKKTAKEYLDFINSNASQYIRVNSLKINPVDLAQNLFNYYGIESEIVPEIPNCLKIIKGQDKIGKTVQHIIGDYYIQSLSSMLPPVALNPDKKDFVLDLCSAPGSKTTQLGEMMKNNGTLIANEITLDRVKMCNSFERGIIK